ncbi:MAG TPA: hypothetical protein VK906_16400 [Egicoccus sp.]|nr:hypothetical protein [Egicoccus sp.]HSK24768.1 hypothetical protein [Egicoccus sp.]
MKLRSRFLPLAVAGALALTACATPEDDADVSAGGVDTEATDTEAEVEATESEPADDADDADDDAEETDANAGAVELAVESGDLGDRVVDAEGNAVYVSTDDEDGVSNCGPECARIWQPVEGEATVTGDLDESLLGTADREDGTTQVTYNGAPLYRFVADQAGDTRGHGVNGTWFAAGTDGEPILEGGLQNRADETPADEPTEDAGDDA